MNKYEEIISSLNINPSIVDSNVIAFTQECCNMIELYAKKNSDYGNSFEEGLQKIGNAYAVGRLFDKVNRLIHLIKHTSQIKDETMQDTIRDLACYAVMYICTQNKPKEL